MKTLASLSLTIILIGMAPLAYADATPDTQSIIDSLKPGKTRSLRNLMVQPAANEVPQPATQPPATSGSSPTGNVSTPAPAHTVEATAPAKDKVKVPAAPAPAPAVIASPQQTAPADEAPSISLAINFEFNSSRVSASSQSALAHLAAALKSPELSDSHFLIEGHTDAKGSASYNRKLSQQRADEVKRTLVAQGVDAGRLKAVGKGADAPANLQDRFAAENRRVRIVNIIE